MQPVRAGLWTLFVWAFCAVCAQADEGVVLGERAELRPGLCAALRIQLSGLADVRCEREQSTNALNERIDAASARVRALGARLYVLLERDPTPALVRMYIVSGASDQAVLTVERIENRPDPDVDRSLALKVRDAYEVSEVVREKAPEIKAPVVAAVLAPPPTTTPLPARVGSEHHLLLELGGGINLGARGLPLAVVSLGFSRVMPRARFDLTLGARVSGRRDEVKADARAALRERGPTLSARALRRTKRFEVGGGLATFLALLSADGVAQDGARAEKTRVLPTLSAELDLMVHLFASAYVRLAPALELALLRHRFTIDGDVVVDERSMRITIPLSLLVTLPVGGVKEREGLRP